MRSEFNTRGADSRFSETAATGVDRRILASKSSALVNFGLYQLGWFGGITLASAGNSTLAAGFIAGLVAFHLALARSWGGEAILVLAAAALGLGVETALVELGVLEYAARSAAIGSVPLWIIALWMQFATTLRFCLGWLAERYVLAVLVGAVGGPLAFAAGARLGAATLGADPALSLALIALSWSFSLPILVALGDRLARGGDGSGRYVLDLNRLLAISSTLRFEESRAR